MTLTPSAIRFQARDRLTGKYRGAISIFLLGEMFSMGLEMLGQEVLTILSPAGSLVAIPISIAINFLLALPVGVFAIGYAYFYLNAACGQLFHPLQLLHGFRNNSTKSLQFAAIFTGLRFLCFEPARYLLAFFLRGHQVQLFLGAILAFLIGLLVYLPLYISLSQSLYLLLDFPEKSTWEILKAGSEIMRGNRMRYLSLLIGLLPMHLFAILSFGIGYLWVQPYISMSKVCFFLDLMQHREKE